MILKFLYKRLEDDNDDGLLLDALVMDCCSFGGCDCCWGCCGSELLGDNVEESLRLLVLSPSLAAGAVVVVCSSAVTVTTVVAILLLLLVLVTLVVTVVSPAAAVT